MTDYTPLFQLLHGLRADLNKVMVQTKGFEMRVGEAEKRIMSAMAKPDDSEAWRRRTAPVISADLSSVGQRKEQDGRAASETPTEETEAKKEDLLVTDFPVEESQTPSAADDVKDVQAAPDDDFEKVVETNKKVKQKEVVESVEATKASKVLALAKQTEKSPEAEIAKSDEEPLKAGEEVKEVETTETETVKEPSPAAKDVTPAKEPPSLEPEEKPEFVEDTTIVELKDELPESDTTESVDAAITEAIQDQPQETEQIKADEEDFVESAPTEQVPETEEVKPAEESIIETKQEEPSDTEKVTAVDVDTVKTVKGQPPDDTVPAETVVTEEIKDAEPETVKEEVSTEVEKESEKDKLKAVDTAVVEVEKDEFPETEQIEKVDSTSTVMAKGQPIEKEEVAPVEEPPEVEQVTEETKGEKAEKADQVDEIGSSVDASGDTEEFVDAKTEITEESEPPKAEDKAETIEDQAIVEEAEASKAEAEISKSDIEPTPEDTVANVASLSAAHLQREYQRIKLSVKNTRLHVQMQFWNTTDERPTAEDLEPYYVSLVRSSEYVETSLKLLADLSTRHVQPIDINTLLKVQLAHLQYLQERFAPALAKISKQGEAAATPKGGKQGKAAATPKGAKGAEAPSERPPSPELRKVKTAFGRPSPALQNLLLADKIKTGDVDEAIAIVSEPSIRRILEDPHKERKEEVLEWISAVTGDASITKEPFEQVLKNGVVICELMNKLSPGSVKKIQKKGTKFTFMENIQAFQAASKKYGLPEEEIFMPTDLVEARNIPAVLNSLSALARVAQDVGYTGPTMGPKMAHGKDLKAGWAEQQKAQDDAARARLANNNK